MHCLEPLSVPGLWLGRGLMDLRWGRETSLPLSKIYILLVLAVSLVNANVYAEVENDDDGHEDIKEQADQLRRLLLVEDLAGLDEGGVPVDGRPLSSFLRHCDSQSSLSHLSLQAPLLPS